MTHVPEDEPLDPAVEAIRRRLVRLLMVSGGIMAVGLMTVIIAIFYRLNAGDAPVGEGETLAVALPAGAELIDSQADIEGLTVTFRDTDGLIETRRYDAAGNLVRSFQLIEE